MEQSQRQKEREALILAALLHDIGKLVQRADNDPQRMTHQEFGSLWLQERGITGKISHLVERHHLLKKSHFKYDSLDAGISRASLTICQADWLSAQERPEKETSPEEEGEWRSDIPLLSIFSRVRLNGVDKDKFNQNEEKLRYYTPGAIGDVIPYPQQNVTVTRQDYKRCLEAFEKDFLQIKEHLTPDNLLVLLEKHTSFIPSETRVVKGKVESYPDVSLFDHLKLTAAIAAAIDLYLEENYPEKYRKNDLLTDEIQNIKDKKFLLIGGDFSGVQNFIYTISSKGALKTLRARSFFLEVLTEHVISQFLESAFLPRANVIYSGGGRFYILSPNIMSIKELLFNLTERMNEWLFDKFRGKLCLITGSIALSGEELNPGDKEDLNSRGICNIWSDLGSELARFKSQKFKRQLFAILQPQEPQIPFDKCSICYRDDIKEDELKPLHPENPEDRVCSFCRSLYSLGDELIDMRFLGVCQDEKIARKFCKEPLEIGSVKEGVLWYVPLRKIYGDLKENFKFFYAINTWDLSTYKEGKVAALLLGNYVRKVEDLSSGAEFAKEENKVSLQSTASFDKLAKVARGADRIGVLRMDVDRLGKIFIQGLEYKHRSFSRFASLSRFLNLFFKYYLNLICAGKPGNSFECLDLSEKNPEKGGGRNVSIVYSGGDDLFLVGAWDEVVEVSFDIQKSFRLYTCFNPDITVSAGIFVQHNNFPLHLLADFSGKAEDLAKENGRNRIVLFYNPNLKKKSKRNIPKQVFTWEEAEKEVVAVVKLFKSLGKIDKEKNIFDPGFSHTFLYKLFSIFEQWETEDVLYLPRMAYIYSKLKEEMAKVKKSENEKVLGDIEAILMNSEKIKNLRTSLVWLELLARSGEE